MKKHHQIGHSRCQIISMNAKAIEIRTNFIEISSNYIQKSFFAFSMIFSGDNSEFRLFQKPSFLSLQKKIWINKNNFDTVLTKKIWIFSNFDDFFIEIVQNSSKIQFRWNWCEFRWLSNFIEFILGTIFHHFLIYFTW